MDTSKQAMKSGDIDAKPPAAKKLKTTNATDCGLLSLPEEALMVVASFSAPPDVYNLDLTSKHFHQPDKKANQVLATRLLRASLLSNLSRVLDKTGNGITLDVMMQLAPINPVGEPPHALIAGSSLVQACLGTVWESADVDVYCSPQVGPQVRSWLVEKADSMFIGFKDTYLEPSSSKLAYVLDTKIHHVEHYGNLETNRLESFRWDEADPTEYREQTKEWGRGASMYADDKWSYSLRPLGIDVENPGYRLLPKQGGDLPFDFDGEGDIDLIVSKYKDHRQSESVQPLEVLEDFDLNICKASFDGRIFRISDPHLTFQGKTRMEPMRQQIVTSYQRRFKSRNFTLYRSLEAIVEVREELNMVGSPIFRFVDQALEADELDQDWMGDPYNDLLSRQAAAFLHFHNWIVKLVNRLHKYQNRGIDVLDVQRIQYRMQEESFMH